MFERFHFTKKQIGTYHKSAIRDLKIASEASVPEVSFRFAYDSLLKLSIVVCAVHGLRVKSKKGHHIELISKLANFLHDTEIEVLANEMRSKRNWDLYGGGVIITPKEAKNYVRWVRLIFQKTEKYFEKHPRFDI